MLSSRRLPFFTTSLLLLAAGAAQAADAARLLPADTKAVLTFNLRRILTDHRNTEFVQRYLDQYRLALVGDEKGLKKYYRQQEIDKSEGISLDEFLARCRIVKSACDAMGMDPLEDVDQVTYGFNGGTFAVIVEGRFKQAKFKTAVEHIGNEHFGSFKADMGGVWQIPDRPDGACVSLLDARTLAVTDGKKTMEEVVQLAQGKANANAGLKKGMRSLLTNAQKEHVGVVIDDVDRLLLQLVRHLREDVARQLDGKDVVGKWVVTTGADWIEKYGKEVASASMGVSVREGDFRLQFAIDAKKAASANELSTLMQNGNFWGAIALKTIKSDVAQQLSSILVRQRFVQRDTTLVTQIEVPYEFVKLLLKGPWLNYFAKDLAGPPEPTAKVDGSAMDVLSAGVTSIPFWSLPPRDPTKPLPAGTFAVEQVRDVAYRPGASDPIRQRLDMYLPKGKKDFPVLVLVHGGAWVIGDNRSGGLYTSVGQFLASQGIGVVMPNYRLSPSVKHPEHIKDVAAAFAWTHKHLGKYGGDVKRVYLAGHSAGAHLAALLATDGKYLRAEGLSTSDIKGVIPISGVYKVPDGVMRFSFGGSGPRAMRFESMWPVRGDSDPSWKFQLPGLPAQMNMFAPVFGDTPRACADASPMNHVRGGLPPFLILCADNDLPTLPAMAGEFQESLKQAGCDVRLVKMAKRNHNSLIFSVIRADDPAARLILDFIRK